MAATALHGNSPGVAERQQGPGQDPRSYTVPRAPGTRRPPNQPLNVILIIRDQTRFDLPAAAGYSTPALDRLAQQGISFRNHYIASAMCTPSRAAFYSGRPPQVNGVFDQMETGWVPNLSRDQPNMGSMMKKLGYQTAFFGKWEMEADIIPPKPTVNYSEALQPYGFDIYQPDGDKPGAPNQGYDTDVSTASDGVRWLRGNVPTLRESGQPFFLVMSYLNPHDIMYADANVPGTPQVQQAVSKEAIVTPPQNALYDQRWNTAPSPTLLESLSAPGMPPALGEYNTGWEGVLGTIPTDRPDMWQVFNDYYLNMIRDTDLSLQQLEDGLDELGLWEETVVIFTADHGEMAGDHGGIRGKGPMAYEGNPCAVDRCPPRLRARSADRRRHQPLGSDAVTARTCGRTRGQATCCSRGPARPGLFRGARHGRDCEPTSRPPRRLVQLRRPPHHRCGLLRGGDEGTASKQAGAAADGSSIQAQQARIHEFCLRRTVQVRALLRACQLQYADNDGRNPAEQRYSAIRSEKRSARDAQPGPGAREEQGSHLADERPAERAHSR
ncbi:sulfatase-like hydrolase/transferase [Mycobacterium sp. URHB0044]|uniref:sulfatase-like hydrolase/transferase n=1 Tax=Mycobacterium sp. URHB0044 TaxID=1380386 RepID=UPI001E34062D|nr:sulfatase-like hydrolase/transferase [Mycobacterium sp. URHB0044]